MKDITRRDLARRYGYFLDHVQRSEGVEQNAAAAAYVGPDRVDRFLAELEARVSSVTVHGSIYKLRRMAQFLDPARLHLADGDREGPGFCNAAEIKI